MSDVPAEDIGIVTSVSDNRITVEIPKGGGCSSCAMKGLCGSDNRPVILEFETDGQYQVGDKVNVSVSSGVRILSSLIVFLFPLLALFGFFLIGRSFTNELGAVMLGFGGLLLAFFIIRLLDRRIGKHINFQLGGKHEDMP